MREGLGGGDVPAAARIWGGRVNDDEAFGVGGLGIALRFAEVARSAALAMVDGDDDGGFGEFVFGDVDVHLCFGWGTVESCYLGKGGGEGVCKAEGRGREEQDVRPHCDVLGVVVGIELGDCAGQEVSGRLNGIYLANSEKRDHTLQLSADAQA